MILEAIRQEKEKRPDMKQPLMVQNYLNTWEEMKIWWPRCSIGGKILWPGQKVWRYTHEEMCVVRDQAKFGQMSGMYQRWFYLYLTNEEYVMAKLSI